MGYLPQETCVCVASKISTKSQSFQIFSSPEPVHVSFYAQFSYKISLNTIFAVD